MKHSSGAPTQQNQREGTKKRVGYKIGELLVSENDEFLTNCIDEVAVVRD